MIPKSGVEEHPFIEWKNSALDGLLNIASYWRQRRNILVRPGIVFDDGDGILKIRPVAFAIRWMVIFGTIASIFVWLLTQHPDTRPQTADLLIQKVRAVEVKSSLGLRLSEDEVFLLAHKSSKKLEMKKSLVSLNYWLNSVWLALATVLSAHLFGTFLLIFNKLCPRVLQADRCFLYITSSNILLPISFLYLACVTCNEFTERYLPDIYLMYVEPPIYILKFAGAVFFLFLPLSIWLVASIWKASKNMALTLGLTNQLGALRANLAIFLAACASLALSPILVALPLITIDYAWGVYFHFW